MCGLFGWSFASGAMPSRKRLNALASALAVANDIRGGDSWGYFAPLTGRVRRGLGEMAHGLTADSLSRHPLLMAHTRYATTGRVTERNAHPFRAGLVVGAHNGMVYNHEALNAAYRRRCQVDSQHIFRHIAEGEALSEISAYGAIEFVRLDMPEVIRLGRFNGGSLAVASLPGGGIVWSSAAAHLDGALTLAGLDGSPLPVCEGVLYAVRAGRMVETATPLPFRPRPAEPKREPDPPPAPADDYEADYLAAWQEYERRESEWARWH